MRHLLKSIYKQRLSWDTEVVTGKFDNRAKNEVIALADSKVMDAPVFFIGDQLLDDNGYKEILPEHPHVDKPQWPTPQGRLPYKNMVCQLGREKNALHYYRNEDIEFCVVNFYCRKKERFFDGATYCLFSDGKVDIYNLTDELSANTWEAREAEKETVKLQQRVTFMMLNVVFRILGDIQSQPSMTPVTAGNRDIKSGLIGDQHKFYRINTAPTMGVSSGMTRDYQPRRNHQVRGHWRTYANGNRTWVRSHKRGDETLGIITKDYILEAAE